MKPCIICVAITGSLPRKADNPAVPITVPEQIESTHAAFEAGATIVHAHVRNDDETPSADPEKFARLKEGIEKHCPGMIIQFSTGGRSGAGQARGGMLPLRPDMASLSVGSNNFPTRVYENPPDLVDWLASEMLAYDIKPEIECFDLSHIHQAAAMQADGRLKAPAYVQFVMGVKNAPHCRTPAAGFRMVRRRHRTAPDHLERMVRRRWRPCPHGAGGQCPPVTDHACPVQCGPRHAGGRDLRQGGKKRRLAPGSPRIAGSEDVSPAELSQTSAARMVSCCRNQRAVGQKICPQKLHAFPNHPSAMFVA